MRLTKPHTPLAATFTPLPRLPLLPSFRNPTLPFLLFGLNPLSSPTVVVSRLTAIVFHIPTS